MKIEELARRIAREQGYDALEDYMGLGEMLAEHDLDEYEPEALEELVKAELDRVWGEPTRNPVSTVEITEEMIRAAQSATRCDPAECDECIAGAIAAAAAIVGQTPGERPHDVLAANAVRAMLVDILTDADPDEWGGFAVDAGVSDVMNRFSVAWERATNERGVAVRRPVLVGSWEVDPERVAQVTS